METKSSGYIRFALVLKNDKEVRTIEDLKDNFDVYQILESCVDGKLAEWLQDRGFPEEAKRIDNVYNEDICNRASVRETVCKICEILKVQRSGKIDAEISEYETELPEDENADGVDGLEQYHPSMRKFFVWKDKAAKIDRRTGDRNARINFRQVALNQEDLELLIKREKKIYLLPIEDIKEKNIYYEIPADLQGYVFIGVEDTEQNIPKVVLVAGSESKQPLYQEEVKEKRDAIKLSNLKIAFQPTQGSNEQEDAGENEKIQLYGVDCVLNKIDEKLPEELGLSMSKKGKESHSEEDSFESVKKRIMRYMDANFPLLYLNTFEEEMADDIICSVLVGRKFFEWNAEGFFEKNKYGNRVGNWIEGWSLHDTLNLFIRDDLYHTSDGASEDDSIANYNLNQAVLVLKDAPHLLNDPKIIAQLKYLSHMISNGTLNGCNIVIVSPILVIPKELEKYLSIITLDCPTEEEIKEIVDKRCADNNVPKPDENVKQKIMKELKGLSRLDIINIISLAISVDRELNARDFPLIRDYKKQMIKKMNVLEIIDADIEEDDIGGLEVLKGWLENKATIFKNWDKAAEHHVDIPKGVMITGMPGCGKSITAKMTADKFEMPLLRMDIGKIMGKYVGESEAKMHQALRMAQNAAPCVLWIDEIEKAFSGINGDGGGAEVTTRLFGIFLTWMQEKKAAVFVVATSNDATRLPPELLRKGRFDEIFYVGFPSPKERLKIFDIHFSKRGKKEEWYKLKENEKDLKRLSRKTHGYTGADIEGVVRETIERIFVETEINKTKKKTSDNNISETLFEVISETTPLKKSMKRTLKGLLRIHREGGFKNASKVKKGEVDGPENLDDEDRYGGWKGKLRGFKEDSEEKLHNFRHKIKDRTIMEFVKEKLQIGREDGDLHGASKPPNG